MQATTYPTVWRAMEHKQGSWPSFWSVVRDIEPGINETFTCCQMLDEQTAKNRVDELNRRS